MAVLVALLTAVACKVLQAACAPSRRPQAYLQMMTIPWRATIKIPITEAEELEAP